MDKEYFRGLEALMDGNDIYSMSERELYEYQEKIFVERKRLYDQWSKAMAREDTEFHDDCYHASKRMDRLLSDITDCITYHKVLAVKSRRGVSCGTEG